MMARYIDADKFAERIKMSPAFNKIGFDGDLLQKVVLDLLDNMPAADVVEVKHGEWLDCIETGTTVAGITNSGFVGYKCSLCGRYEGKKEPYCNCGTKMDVSKMEITTERSD